MRALFTLVAIVAVAVNGVVAQAPAPRAFLLLVDDLHLDFRQTPRTRAMVQRLLRDVAREGDIWAIATTGTSSLNVPATTDVTAVTAAVSRVTGNALKPSELLTPTPGSNALLEAQHRVAVASKNGADALQRLAAARPNASLIVLHISNGYDARALPGMADFVRAVATTRAYLIVVSPAEFFAGLEPPAGVPADQWRAYIEARQTSLRSLAEQTGGIAVGSREALGAINEAPTTKQ
jgi:hypothetical protein